MLRSLEWVIGEQGPQSPITALIGRRLQARGARWRGGRRGAKARRGSAAALERINSAWRTSLLGGQQCGVCHCCQPRHTPPVNPFSSPCGSQSRLPSFTDQFTQSVPLTRIRDIAHRCVGQLH